MTRKKMNKNNKRSNYVTLKNGKYTCGERTIPVLPLSTLQAAANHYKTKVAAGNRVLFATIKSQTEDHK